MKIVFSLLLVSGVFAGSITEVAPEKEIRQLRLLDRVGSANFLLDTFGVEGDKFSLAAESVRKFVFNQYPFFSGPCFSAQDAFCPDRSGAYESGPKHSLVREGYKIQACGHLAGDPRVVAMALAQSGLSPSDDPSPKNLHKVLAAFLPKEAASAKISQTERLVSKTEREKGRERAWADFLMLVCSSVGWQID